MKDFFIYVSNKDSLNFFPNNNSSEFESYLGEYVILEGVNWQVGVKEIYIELNRESFEAGGSNLIITSDLCDVSFFQGKKLGLLRKVFLSTEIIRTDYKTQIYFDYPIFIPLKSKKVNSVKIITEFQEETTNIVENISLTLQFKKIW